MEEIHIAAHLHDIGKIGISDQVLQKPGRLLPHEFAVIQRHPVIGYQVLIQSQRLKKIATIVQHHHERWDGRGYPAGLTAEAIPLGSRIIAVCDAVDAMTRSLYKKQKQSGPCGKQGTCWKRQLSNRRVFCDRSYTAKKIYGI